IANEMSDRGGVVCFAPASCITPPRLASLDAMLADPPPSGEGEESRPVPPDLVFILLLLIRMAVAAAFVVSASVITERAGPAIGALITTLPVSAGPAYVFLALDHDAAFIAQGALASLPINAATIFLSLTYVLL